MESLAHKPSPSQVSDFHSGDSRPDILSVIGRYTSLRRHGREELGLCPLHDDRRPSLRVNPDKGVWYCHPCGTGGDVIRFIQLVEGVDFKGALAVLGMVGGPQPPRHSPARQQAEWANDQIQRMNARLRELDEMVDIADEVGDVEIAESLWRERRILADMRDDLSSFEYRQDFIQIKDVIEKITETERS
jgi:DNA primase